MAQRRRTPLVKPAAQPSILLVEGESPIARLVQHILGEKVHLSHVSTSHEATVAVEQCTFDLMLIDIWLETDTAGIDLLHHARTCERSANTDTHAVAFTACAWPGDKERLLAEGFDSYFAKPFLAEDLVSLVAASLPAHCSLEAP